MKHRRIPLQATLLGWAQQKLVAWALALLAALLVSFSAMPRAAAVPAFARKYQTSCQTCHVAFPTLTPFGEAFRRDGFRFPSQDGSVDSDAQKSDMLPLGQEAYTKVFPNAVWPDQIPLGIPLGVIVNASTAVNLPRASAYRAAGNTFAWNDLVGEFALFAAGAFNDSLTYFTEVTVSADGAGIEHAFLTWNDVLGPRHLVNVSLGRLAPTLTSWGMHSAYLSDTLLPSATVAALYNPNGPTDSLATLFGHPDGIELTGVVVHRLGYSLGWVASGTGTGLATPDSQDVYAHIGYKFGGMSLDGEARGDVNAVDARHPWGETALTVDLLGFHGLSRVDNGTGVDGPVPQNDSVDAVGTVLRGQIGSFTLTTGAIVERHSQPYAGTAATPAVPPAPAVPGPPDYSSARVLVQYNELSYVIYPWLIPAVRGEFVRVPLDSANGGGSADLFRALPGVTVLFRPNIRLALLGEFEHARSGPPTGSWGAAGASIAAQPPGRSKLEAERVVARLAWGF